MDDSYERLSAERVEVSRSLVGMASGSEVELEQSAVQRVLGRDVELEQSAAVAVRAEHISLDESGALGVFANRVDAQNTAAFIVVTPSVSGNVRSVIDPRTAFMFGAGFFAARALLQGVRRLLSPGER
jgi:hypothetical protein